MYHSTNTPPAAIVPTGRIAALSWPASSRRAIMEEVGDAPPAPSARKAWNKALASLHRGSTIVRQVAFDAWELVEEVIENGRGVSRDVAERVEWPHRPPSLEKYRGVFERAFEKASETIDAAGVAAWCDAYVKEHFQATALHTRGHLLHVMADHAEAFDRFVAAMRKATGGNVFVAASVDNDPVTLLSLAESLRAGTLEVIEAEKAKAVEAKTERGLAGCRTRLAGQLEQLERYRGLLGDVVGELEKEIQAANEGIAIATVRAAFDDLPTGR